MDDEQPYEKRHRFFGSFSERKRGRNDPPFSRKASTKRALNFSDDEDEDEFYRGGDWVGFDSDGGGDGPEFIALPDSLPRPGRHRSLAHLRCLPEKGAIDFDINGAFTHAGRILVDSLSWITQGPALHQRVGESANLDKLYIHGSIHLPSQTDVYNGATQQNFPTSNGAHRCRVVVVLDKQSRGSIPSVTDVFNPPGFPIDPIYGMRYLPYQSRFDVLDDQIIDFGARAPSCGVIYDAVTALYHWQWAVPQLLADYRCTIDLRKLCVEYDDSAAPGYHSVRSNNIFIIGFTTDSGAFNLPEAQFFSRLRFYA